MVKEIYCTDGSIAVVDDEDFEAVATFNWYPTNAGVISRRYRDGRKQACVTLARVIWDRCGRQKKALIYPKNGDNRDLRRDNLDSKPSQGKKDSQSRGHCGVPGGRGTSDFKGLYWNKSRSYWEAAISVGAVKRRLGSFSCEKAAARAYDKAAHEAWGSDCYLNFPEDFGLPARRIA